MPVLFLVSVDNECNVRLAGVVDVDEIAVELDVLIAVDLYACVGAL